MNVTVYCGASGGNDRRYTEAAAELGRWIGANGHRLVYGGGKVGMMGSVADSVLASGGKVTGVIPRFMAEKDLGHQGIDEMIVVETMGERKRTMIDLGDLFIALPGGSGTLEEISEIASRCQLGLTHAHCVFFSVMGYYDQMKKAYDNMVDRGFLTPENRKKISFVESVDELETLLRTADYR